MKSTEIVRLIAGRELASRIRTKAFLIGTLITILLIVALAVGVKLFGGSDPMKVAVLDARISQQLSAAGSAVGQEIEITTVADRAEGEAQVRDGEVEALVLADPMRAVVKEEIDESLESALNIVSLQSVLTAEPPRVQVTSLEGADEHEGQRLALASVIGVLLFMIVFQSGMWVAQGVVEEKTSRIVEILLSSVRPWQLLLGKVVGIGAAALIQLGSVIAVGVAVAIGTGVLDISGTELIGTALLSLAWFFVGYAMYAVTFAALGSLVSRQEELGGATAPATTLLMVPYLMAVSVVPNAPDSTMSQISSLIPFFAPILMPVRAAFGVPLWEQLTAFGLALLTIVVLVWFAGRVYENSVLRIGSRISLKDALRGG